MKIRERVAGFLFRRRLRGAVRFHHWACGGRRLPFVTRDGVALRLDPYQYIDAIVLRWGFYEREVLNAALASLRPGDVFWDVGANLGLHALTVAKLVPGARVYAFEPNPAMVGRLREAAASNGLSVEVMPLALHHRDGTAPFYVAAGNAGRSALQAWDSSFGRPIEVATARAESLIADRRVPPPNVIKLDVEGSEKDFWQGLGDVRQMPGLRSVIFEDSPDDRSEIKQALRDGGFRVTALRRLEPTQHDLENYAAHRLPG